MDKPKIGNKHYKQGKFSPRNPSKYAGNPTNILYRSSWELCFLKWCDTNPAVLKYCSEEMIVPYISPIDNKQHRYFIDFVIFVRTREGNLKRIAIEIKPYAETILPRTKKNLITESDKQKYQKKVETYYINQTKWKYAKVFCKNLGMDFIVLTERELFKKKKR